MPNRKQAIIWTNAEPIHWRMCATLGGDELTQMFIASVCKPFSTVWAPMSNIFYSSRNLWTLNYLKSNKLHFWFFFWLQTTKTSLNSIMKQLSLPYWYLSSTYSSQHIKHILLKLHTMLYFTAILQTKIKFETLLQFILIFYSKQAGPVTSFIF